MSHYIEFPTLGWKIPLSDTIAEFEIFGIDFTIKWYGVLIAIGMMLAVMYGLYRARDFDLNSDAMMDIALITIPIALLGARLYYVLSPNQIDNYLDDPLSMLYIWEGGLGIYGGIIFAFLFGPFICRWRKQSTLAMMDIASLGFLIGQAVGRWGNFFNQEAFGGNTTLPWGMTGDIIKQGIHGTGYDTTLPVPPTFLYESLWCILGFVLLHFMSKYFYKFKGQIFCGYVVWYGVGRFFIEGLRTDSLMTGTLKTSQVVALLAVVGGLIFATVLYQRTKALPKTLVTEYGDVDSTLAIDGEAQAETTDNRQDTQEEEQNNGNEN